MADRKITREELNKEFEELTKREYTLGDLYAGKPAGDFGATFQNMQAYNKTQIPDKRLYPHVPLQHGGYALNKLQQGFDDSAGTNAQDNVRYFHPKAKYRASKEAIDALGFVEPTVDFNRVNITGSTDFRGKITPLNTLLHEVSHVEDYNRGDRKVDLFGEVPGIDYVKLIENLPPEIKNKYFPAGNAFLNSGETRANLRAGLGSQPKGTTEQDYFAELLKYAPEMGVKYIPTEAKGHYDSKTLRTKEEILKGLLNDLFPRERWIEPREPTMKEKIQDYINKLLAK